MTTRFAVFGFSAEWQKESVISAVRGQSGKIVYWNLNNPVDIERCEAAFPGFENLSLTSAAKFKADAQSFLYSAAQEIDEFSAVLWPSFYKSSAKHNVVGAGLDTHAVFYTQIGIAVGILNKLKPDVLLFGNVPTGFVPFACYLIAKKRGLKIRILRRILLPGITNLSLLSDSIENACPIENAYHAAIKEKAYTRSIDLPENIRSQLEKLRAATDTESASPEYFKEKIQFNRRDKAIKGPSHNFFKAAYHSVLQGQYRQSLGGYDTIVTLIRRHRLYRQYNSLTSTPSLDVPYIYVPLHYQPEASTVPNGGIFAQQHFMVDLLSKLAPKGWRIYVKEHPSQLLYYYPNKLFRSYRYYEELASYPNVSLLPISEPSNVELIRNAKAVATVTGHSGWEAINWRIPALVFGAAWYGACDGVHRVSDMTSLQTAFEKLMADEKPDSRKIALYLSLICRHAIVGEYRTKAANAEPYPHARAEHLVRSLQQSLENPISSLSL